MYTFLKLYNMPYLTGNTAASQPTARHDFKGLYHEHLFDQSPSAAIVRSAWFILLARYSQSESIEVQTASFNDCDTAHIDNDSLEMPLGSDPMEIMAPFDLSIDKILHEIETTTTSDICFTSGNVNTFPLAENNGFGPSERFRTAVISWNSNEQLCPANGLSDCHIVLKHSNCEVSLWLDSRICSANHDPGLPTRLLAQLKLVVAQLSTSKPGLVLGDLSFMTKVDLKDSNAYTASMPPTQNSLLHELIMQNARKTPNAPALCAWDGTITYAEFDAVTTSLALKLRAAGVTVGTFVPLITEKSMWALVSMLAINKAGGAFVTMVSTIITLRCGFPRVLN